MKKIIFKSISMNNFRCYESMEFSFVPNRFCAITGKNGSGKSTIFDAILFALYDTSLKRKISKDSVIRKRSGNNCAVILSVIVDEILYEVRTYRGHKVYGDKKFLFRDGSDISGATRSETNNKINDIIMPQQIFINTVFMNSVVNNSFIELTHSEQKDILDRILLLDKYEFYQDIFKEKNRNIIKDLDIAEHNINFIDSSLTDFEKDMHEYLSKSIELSKKYVNIKKRYNYDILEIDKELKILTKHDDYVINNIAKDILQLKEKYIETKTFIDKKMEMYNKDVSNQNENFKNKFNLIKNEIMREYEKSSNEISCKINEFNILEKDKIIEVDKELSKLDKYYHDKNKEIEDRRKGAEDIKFNIKTIMNEIKTLNVRKVEYEEKIHNEKLRLEKIKNGLNQKVPLCFACGQPITFNEIGKLKLKTLENEAARNLKEYSVALERNNENIADLERSKLDKLRDKYEKEIKEINYMTTTLEDDIENKKKIINMEKSGFLVDINKKRCVYDDKLNNLKNEYKKKIEEKKDELLLNLKRYEEELRCELEKEIYTKKESMDKINQDIDLLKSKEISYNKENEKIYKLENKRDLCIHSKVSELKNVCELIKNTRGEYKKRKQKYIEMTIKRGDLLSNKELLENYKNMCQFWIEGFSDRGIKSILMDEIIPILNNRAMELNEYITNIRVSFDSMSTTKSGEFRDKFSINAVQTVNLTDNIADMSSGEKALIHIIVLFCIRSLLEKIQGCTVNLYILDEFLDTLDSDNALIVADLLKVLSKDHCVCLISHTHRDWIDSDEMICL